MRVVRGHGFKRGLIATLAAMIVLLLTACSGISERKDATSSNASGGAPPAGATSAAEDLVPVGFPDSVDCEKIDELIPEFTDGLHLNGASIEPAESRGEVLTCVWSDVPLETLTPSSENLTTKLDVFISATFQDDMDANYRDSWCDQIRGQSSVADTILDGHGQCGHGTLAYERGSNGLMASVPYFQLSLGVSCNISTECVPNLPDSFTDEAGFSAIRHIADHLADTLEFTDQPT